MLVELTDAEINEIIVAMKSRATDELDIDDLYEDKDFNMPTISGSSTIEEVETTPWLSIMKKLKYGRYDELKDKAEKFLLDGELDF